MLKIYWATVEQESCDNFEKVGEEQNSGCLSRRNGNLQLGLLVTSTPMNETHWCQLSQSYPRGENIHSRLDDSFLVITYSYCSQGWVVTRQYDFYLLSAHIFHCFSQTIYTAQYMRQMQGFINLSIRLCCWTSAVGNSTSIHRCCCGTLNQHNQISHRCGQHSCEGSLVHNKIPISSEGCCLLHPFDSQIQSYHLPNSG